MTNYSPVFNPVKFENTGYTNPYLTPEQKEAVNLTESRVNSQLDWLAQLLGWNGPDYWGNLATTVSEKRRLQVGTFGVYNSYIYPEVIAIRNWDNTQTFTSLTNLEIENLRSSDKLWLVVVKDTRIKEGQNIRLGDTDYPIVEVNDEGDNYVIPLTGIDSTFLTNIAAGEQIKIDAKEQRPAPFYRPTVETAGDESFLCAKTDSGSLEIYPSYNYSLDLPYRSAALVAGSTYSFDKPVYLSRNEEVEIDSVLVQYPVDVAPVYNENSQLWEITVPANYSSNEFGTKAYLVWLFSDENAETFCVKAVTLVQWADPSDWNNQSILDYYLGVWGNKGGSLPFNFVFDSLEISGFDETKSLYLNPVENRVKFDQLLNFVYYQKVAIDPVSPVGTKPGQVWWNSTTGAFSIWRSNPYGCGKWEQIKYPNPPENEDLAEFVYPTVTNFRATQAQIEPGVMVQINDVSGLGVTDGILGLQGTLTSDAALTLFKLENGYWQPFLFTYRDELDFSFDAENLPWNTPVRVENAVNLGTPRTTYEVENLKFIINKPMPVMLAKAENNYSWVIEPVSELKYIGDTRLFASDPLPVQGATNWYYTLPNEETRRAVIYYYSSYVEEFGEWVLKGSWVDINSGQAVNAPTAPLNFGTVKVYCDGVLLEPDQDAGFDEFNFRYTIDEDNGDFVFYYTPVISESVLNLPKITISDSVTSVFTFDITEYVFSGLQFYMSPNVRDCETTLRLWKTQDLQVKGFESFEKELTYVNPLVADQNNGPADENWQRYFVRLPPRYERNGPEWQKVTLACQDFEYGGVAAPLSKTECPPEQETPTIYEQACLYRETPRSSTIYYSEPYLFSDISFGENYEVDLYANASILPSSSTYVDEFAPSSISSYEPLHNRRAIVDLPVGEGYGNWEGTYFRVSDCTDISGFYSKDLLENVIDLIKPPLWDASVYKLPKACQQRSPEYAVDLNNYRIGYAYFAADLSCANDGFFDPLQEAAWRYPQNRPKTLYVTSV